MLWASQVAVGNENAVRLRVYGTKAGLDWHQEDPNYLTFCRLGEPRQILTRAGAAATPGNSHASRVPAGHPEGYLEAFGQIYHDSAEQITARLEKRAPNPASLLVPGIVEGVRGMKFITAAVASSRAGSGWTKV
jgi:predicted dehydrogenase